MKHILKENIIPYLTEKIDKSFYENGRLNLEKLCQKFNISYFDANFKDTKLSGAIIFENNKWQILINENDSINRKRFTVAHEIGHFISYQCNSFSKNYIDTNNVISDFAFFRDNKSKNPNNEMEIEANQIASEILMPKADIETLKNENKNVEQMANYFGVSESAMTFRLKNIGYHLFEEMEELKSETKQEKLSLAQLTSKYGNKSNI